MDTDGHSPTWSKPWQGMQTLRRSHCLGDQKGFLEEGTKQAHYTEHSFTRLGKFSHISRFLD
jgi:hypothetical protein